MASSSHRSNRSPRSREPWIRHRGCLAISRQQTARAALLKERLSLSWTRAISIPHPPGSVVRSGSPFPSSVADPLTPTSRASFVWSSALWMTSEDFICSSVHCRVQGAGPTEIRHHSPAASSTQRHRPLPRMPRAAPVSASHLSRLQLASAWAAVAVASIRGNRSQQRLDLRSQRSLIRCGRPDRSHWLAAMR